MLKGGGNSVQDKVEGRNRGMESVGLKKEETAHGTKWRNVFKTISTSPDDGKRMRRRLVMKRLRLETAPTVGGCLPACVRQRRRTRGTCHRRCTAHM